MHIKRKTIPEFWPIAKTGSKYMAVPCHNQDSSIPLVIAMRDVLKLIKTKKELNKIIQEKKILVNGKIIKESNYPVSLFDSISIPSVKKYYKADLSNKRMVLNEIAEKDSIIRIYKIIGKQILQGKKVQLNLSNGRNILSNEKINAGDFVLVNNQENKIMKVIPLKENVEVLCVKGKHIGKKGKIKEIVKEGENLVARLSVKGGEVKANVNNIFVTQ